MKLQQFRQIIREEVKKVFQEEIKDLLMEALKKPTTQQVVTEASKPAIEPSKPVNSEVRKSINEGYKNILGETAAAFNTSHINQPLQMSGNVDTTSPQGKLPEGEVSMDQIMGLMNK